MLTVLQQQGACVSAWSIIINNNVYLFTCVMGQVLPRQLLVQCKQQSRSVKLEVATCGRTSVTVLPEGWASHRSVLGPTFLLPLPAKCPAGSEQKPWCFCCRWFPLLGYQEASRDETRSVAVLCPALSLGEGEEEELVCSWAPAVCWTRAYPTCVSFVAGLGAVRNVRAQWWTEGSSGCGTG